MSGGRPPWLRERWEHLSARPDGGAAQAGVMVVAGLLGIVLLVVLLVVLFAGGRSMACVQVGGRQPGASDAANGIPANYLALYKKAGEDYGIPWNVLAGIGKVESGHGTSKLPGVQSGENFAGAGGPMQFLQGTWNQFGVDGNGDGKKDRYDPADAIPAAANYLRHNHGNEGGNKLRKAIWFYNHSWDYVDLVLSWAKKYADGDFSVSDANNAGTSACLPGAGGAHGRPDGAGAKSPVTGTNMTDTMRKVMLDIDGKFGPFPTIGCTRGGAGAQDHGLGQACDFMETTTGRMPSASALAHGDSVAAYAIANGKRLGIKYIIWKQHIWNITLGDKHWRKMEDRGSITQNHFDHVHISVVN
jgi:hypothetical protein